MDPYADQDPAIFLTGLQDANKKLIPDPDLGGPKTCESGGSGSATLCGRRWKQKLLFIFSFL
jgi:hypothetical protein